MKNCKYCKKEFSGLRSDSIFCSRSCKSNNRKMKKYWLDKQMKKDVKNLSFNELSF